MPDGQVLNSDAITGFKISGSVLSVERTTDQGTPYSYTAVNVTPEFLIRQIENIVRGISAAKQVTDKATNTVTFSSATPNPANMKGGTIVITGSGFDTTQPATIECDYFPIEILAIVPINNTSFQFTYPDLSNFPDEFPPGVPIMFRYVFNGNSVSLGFSIKFQ